MKRIIALVLLCAFLPLFVACPKGCRSPDPTNRVLRIGTNANFPPYESIDNKGALIGFDIDFGRALGRALDREVVFKEFDFDALILALDKEQIDIIISGLSITQSRLKEIAMVPYLGEPLTDISLLFWQDVPVGIANFDDLKKRAIERNLLVSVQSGHFLEDFLKGENIPLKPLIGPPEQILDIKYKKSLAAAVDTTVGKKLASEHEGVKNLILPLPKDKWDLGYGIGIKKTRKDLFDEITRVADQLKQDGTIKSLKEKWIKEGQ